LALAGAAAPIVRGRSATPEAAPVPDRIRGLLYGTFLGDALGGPIEFQPAERVAALPDPPKAWRDDEVLDAAARVAAASQVRLRSYAELRPEPEPYAHWSPNAAPGTITDDSRHKLVLLFALRRAEHDRAWPLTARGLARAYLDWLDQDSIRSRPAYRQLGADWLGEWLGAARWVLGERDVPRALPPERLWGGLPTCCGQMTLPPIAALYAGAPAEAYRAAYQLAFFDNGFGRDLNAALVAGLAAALAAPAAPARGAAGWAPLLETMRRTDPYAYGRVPWVQRPVDRWLDLALRLADEAAGRPARLFAALEREFRDTIKWEAQVPFVVVFACLALADYDPLAALQLSVEWGHDTDSYAQLLGALAGARHGADLFPAALRRTVAERLAADYGADIEADAALLDRLRQRTPTARPGAPP
jgi:ADP-ribosylglycohydrolase